MSKSEKKWFPLSIAKHLCHRHSIYIMAHVVSLNQRSIWFITSATLATL
jgi:hypothetical protein